MNQFLISKTTFLDYLFCAKNIWLKLHKPELLEKFALSEFEKHLLEQGNEVDVYARNLFPEGVEIISKGEEAVLETSRFLSMKAPAIFQATFVKDGFLAKNDILAYDKKNDKWDLYEVKGTNSLKENVAERDHIDDLTFQASVLKREGVNVGKYFLVHLNKDYVKRGKLNVEKLFLKEDVTDKVLNKLGEIEEKMEVVRNYLMSKQEPKGSCECLYKGRSKHCTTFSYSNPQVPDYSVHDLARIGSSKRKLQTFIENEIFHLHDVPEDMELSDIQWNQIRANKHSKISINHEEISRALKDLKFPLYFFDYETFAPAIPVFNGFKPYQRIPFQFSLHVLEKPETKLKHFEYLHEKLSDPSERVAELLEKYIEPQGTVIVWNKSFEAGVNKEIGDREPKYKKIMERINNQTYDLMDIFRDQHYVHHEFRGSVSIKKVLPALISEQKLSYKTLQIKEGGQASNAWWQMVSPEMISKQKAQIAKDLKIYCGVDTKAMYEIWKHLYELL